MSEDTQLIRELAAVSDGDASHTILHYLYVPTSEIAGRIAEMLGARGFSTESRLGGDGVNWLVLARHEVIPAEELISSVRHSMTALAASVGGEYDGWEVSVRRPGGG